MYKLIVTDLDDTLLHADKTISQRTVSVLEKCRRKGFLLGVATARGETNTLQCVAGIRPELIISSAGALARYRGEIVYRCCLDREETEKIIDIARHMTGGSCEIGVDTVDAYYRNYREESGILPPDRIHVRYTDFRDFREAALKLTIRLPDEKKAGEIAREADCDCMRFLGSDWYKFTRREATKEDALRQAVHKMALSVKEVIAFGDDLVDRGMLRISGMGVAMGNALPEVKEAADAVTGSNEEDGVAAWLEEHIL